MTAEQTTDIGRPGLSFLVWLGKALTAFVVGAWISADTDIKILFVLSASDFILSLFNSKLCIAIVTKRLAVMWLLVGTVHVVWWIAHNEAHISIGSDISALVAIFYCLGEAVKILKSCAEWTQLPPRLVDILSKVDGVTKQDKRELAALKAEQDRIIKP